MKRLLQKDGPVLGLAVLVALCLKLAYARLGPDELTWILGPTQALVTLLTGVDFVYEDGYGYVSLAHTFVIAKSCAGINYLLAAFGMLAFSLIPKVVGQRRKLLLLGSLAGLAFAATLLANSLRITLALALHDAGVSWGWLTPERVHRAAGIAVYFVALVGVQALAHHGCLPARHNGHAASRLVSAPLFWYGLVALVIPLLNGALAARPRLFGEHAAWVLGITALLTVALSALSRLRRPSEA